MKTADELPVRFSVDEIRPFSNERAAIKKDGLWGFINEQGNIVIPCNYQEVTDFDFVALVKDKQGWQFVTKKGKLLGQYSFTSIEDYLPYGYWVQYNNRWGFTNRYGQLLTPICYEEMRLVDDESRIVFHIHETPVNRAGRWGVLNGKGKLLVRCLYRDIRNMWHNSAEGLLNSRWETIFSKKH